MDRSDQLRQVFLESASEVLETMCFVGVLGENAEPGEAELVAAELLFDGNLSGRFGVQMTPATGRIIAANFLGKEAEDISAAEIEQVLGELANMICGSVLSRIQTGARFELLHPAIVPAGESLSHAGAVRSVLELEEGCLVLWMVITESLSSEPAFCAA